VTIAKHSEKNISKDFGDKEFHALAILAKQEFGLNLAESKKPLVYSRISKRLKARGIKSFRQYLEIINLESETSERQALISALTTNVTSFFREKHHFDILKNEIIEPLRANAQGKQRLRIWSAGCSTGQEPYSIAMTILDTLTLEKTSDIKILATDIDPLVIQKAKNGIYKTNEHDSIPKKFLSRFSVDLENEIEICGELKNIITFAELNLMKPWPFQGPFDAIFCRNVAIYFDHETQKILWQKLSDLLREGGIIFVGHSERISGPAIENLSAIGITSYLKKTGSNKNANSNRNEK